MIDQREVIEDRSIQIRRSAVLIIDRSETPLFAGP
jgi:hypothetical protein